MIQHYSRQSATNFRALLASNSMLVAPGAFNGMTARLVEQAGFQAVYMTGAGTALSLGYPDLGIVTMSEMAANATTMARSVGVPVLADADTGFGNELNISRTIHEYERSGVAGLHLEDQVNPKRCGHTDGKEVVSRREFLTRIRAALNARSNPDFVIIARTDARSVLGFEEAMARAEEALALGADLVFVEAPQTIAEIEAVPRQFGRKCLLNIAPGGKGPVVSTNDAEQMGYGIAIVPGLLLMTIIEACDKALSELKSQNYPPEHYNGMTIAGMFKRFGADEWDALRL